MQAQQEREAQQLFSSITNQSDRQYLLAIMRKIAADQVRPAPRLRLVVSRSNVVNNSLLSGLG